MANIRKQDSHSPQGQRVNDMHIIEPHQEERLYEDECRIIDGTKEYLNVVNQVSTTNIENDIKN